MIKRTIEISQEPVHVSVAKSQLILKRNGVQVGDAPCEDIGMVVVDHPQTTYSHAALAALANSGAVLVVCGDDHLPSAMLLPLSSHSQVVWRLADQIAAPIPLQKQLWKQLIVSKITGQSQNLIDGSVSQKRLQNFAGRVRSGDPENIESQAARVYWNAWLDNISFRRHQTACDLNCFLNYGYSIIRAAIARAVVAAGLHPAIGLHHSSRSNAFCLVDDLIEPFRPTVDRQVREMWDGGYEELNQTAKAELLGLLTHPFSMNDQSGPFLVMIHRMVASLVRCFSGETRILEIPRPCESAGTE